MIPSLGAALLWGISGCGSKPSASPVSFDPSDIAREMKNDPALARIVGGLDKFKHEDDETVGVSEKGRKGIRLIQRALVAISRDRVAHGKAPLALNAPDQLKGRAFGYYGDLTAQSVATLQSESVPPIAGGSNGRAFGSQTMSWMMVLLDSAVGHQQTGL